MDPSRGSPDPHRRNILTLDGGGVRGLSSLLILRALMEQINLRIRDASASGGTQKSVEPHDIFDLVAGTSTGGLIAIMLGKLGMGVQECIDAYHGLSEDIFGKKHFMGKMTHGLSPSKFSGARLRRCIGELLKTRGFGEDLRMLSNDGSDRIACAVVCREHSGPNKYSDLKDGAVCICSLQCPDESDRLQCLVSEAARATSAAPTFFPVQKIGTRVFQDGGMEFNNPSYAIFYHYSEYDRAAGSRRVPPGAGAAPGARRHGNLTFSRTRFVNLGTGTKVDSLLPSRERGILGSFVPGLIRRKDFLLRTLIRIAVNAEEDAKKMQLLAYTSGPGTTFDIKYERFSADTGVCYIELDSYDKLREIQELTRQYLEKEETQNRLRLLADEIATEYLERNCPGASPGLAVPERNLPMPLNASAQPSDLSVPNSQISRDSLEDSIRNDCSTEISVESAAQPGSTATQTFPIPSRQMTDIVLPAESMVSNTSQCMDTSLTVRT